MEQKFIVLLGATGSIGDSTLDILRINADKYQLFGVSAHHNLRKLAGICIEFHPAYAVVTSLADLSQLQAELLAAHCPTEILQGESALASLVADGRTDIVVAAIVGAAGLKSTMAAVEAGKRVLLANKEALVMTGHLFMSAVQASGAELLPIDSEHNAIYQCLPLPAQRLGHNGFLADHGITHLLLTASGGPFRSLELAELAAVTPKQACNHPNWSMGQKISVDSASLMNKGLELIEACWLFNLTVEQVQVHIHPESIVHSLVAYKDGSILAQLGSPDMRTPIAYGLSWPERIDAGVETLDLFAVGQLNFSPPDRGRFPCLGLAEQAFREGGTAPAILNAANEIAVQAFLQGHIKFTDIAIVNETVVNGVASTSADSLEQVFAADEQARIYASGWVKRQL